jgi:hypothetical protein
METISLNKTVQAVSVRAPGAQMVMQCVYML